MDYSSKKNYSWNVKYHQMTSRKEYNVDIFMLIYKHLSEKYLFHHESNSIRSPQWNFFVGVFVYSSDRKTQGIQFKQIHVHRSCKHSLLLCTHAVDTVEKQECKELSTSPEYFLKLVEILSLWKDSGELFWLGAAWCTGIRGFQILVYREQHLFLKLVRPLPTNELFFLHIFPWQCWLHFSVNFDAECPNGFQFHRDDKNLALRIWPETKQQRKNFFFFQSRNPLSNEVHCSNGSSADLFHLQFSDV